MKTTFFFITSLLIASTSCAQDVTFSSIQKEFHQKLISLVSETDIPVKELNTKIENFGIETYGKNPKVVQKEAEKRFNQLPIFPKSDFESYTNFVTVNKSMLSTPDATRLWLLIGWAPEKLANWVKQNTISKELKPSEFANLDFINMFYPDKTYRLGTDQHPELVVKSLGDIFRIELSMTEQGVFKPTSIQWLKRK